MADFRPGTKKKKKKPRKKILEHFIEPKSKKYIKFFFFLSMEHVRRTQEKTSKCVQWPKLEQCEQQNNVELDYKV